ncbi:MAG: hypothetical protein ACUVWX_06670 [Kiritimatiellia bacterium]
MRTLTYLQFPGHMHRWFRTTNYLERLFPNVCSRTKPMTAFDQPCHMERLVIDTIMEVNWIKLPCEIQRLFTSDTIILTFSRYFILKILNATRDIITARNLGFLKALKEESDIV